MDKRCDVLIQVLWEIQSEDIIDVRLEDPGCDSYKKYPIGTILASWGNKKGKHINHCHEQQKYFSPFLLSVDVIIVKEALVVLANFSQPMAAKMEEPISHMQGWVNIWITIAVKISYSRMIRGAFLLSPLWGRETDWESGLGLGLVK